MASINEMLSTQPKDFDKINEEAGYRSIGMYKPSFELEGIDEEIELPHQVGMTFNTNPKFTLPTNQGILLKMPDNSERTVSLVGPDASSEEWRGSFWLKGNGISDAEIPVGTESLVTNLYLENEMPLSVRTMTVEEGFAVIDFHCEGNVIPLDLVDLA